MDYASGDIFGLELNRDYTRRGRAMVIRGVLPAPSGGGAGAGSILAIGELHLDLPPVNPPLKKYASLRRCEVFVKSIQVDSAPQEK
jgi:hypothetical protein